MKKGFTLLELIIVIIIVGILATLGFTTYTNQVESSRLAEAKANISAIRKPAYEYYMKNGTYIGISASTVGIGSTVGLVPNTCVSRNYFLYGVSTTYPATASNVYIYAQRCTSGGKAPQAPSICYFYWGINSSGAASQYGCTKGGSVVITDDWSSCCQ
ncbi:MAG: prepilin-type N-terminal cleavage/methylation domain-containing protein [Candidatus Omnitrophica bacterium]|nr:prepilin-type N-terminal cleavage/methylation domain-containing protein [Candidatus Omnitrophota bacterium]